MLRTAGRYGRNRPHARPFTPPRPDFPLPNAVPNAVPNLAPNAPPPAPDAAASSRPLGVALFGMGTVGGGVADRIVNHAGHLAAACGRPVVLRHAVVRDAAKRRDVALPPGTLHADRGRAIDDPAVDVGVELIGGVDDAFDLCAALLRAGRDVVTANKAMLCERGPELLALARERGRTVCYEAAVAGGVPVVAGVAESLAANRISGIRAILNGTSNFLLTRMTETGADYAAALAEAQDRGYAEADPTMDVDGTDAAQKLVLLARLAFGAEVSSGDFPVAGVDGLDVEELRFAAELGYAVKLLAVAERTGDGLALSVRPTLVPAGDAVARTGGAMNVVAVRGDLVGEAWFAGPGAGREPTASAVLGDLVGLATGRAERTAAALAARAKASDPPPLRPADELGGRFYLRFRVLDRPHVFADLADILGSSGISLASIIQHGAGEGEGEPGASAPGAADDEERVVSVVVMTHRTTAGRVRAAAGRWRSLDTLRGEPVVLPVAD